MPDLEPVIGLEVHAELLTRSKMFCGCAVVDSTSAEPNTSVCEICAGLPGSLPVINRRAFEYALKVALALNCTIAPTSVFARKNYFYPDLPKGYQISQYELPLAGGGWLDIDAQAGEKRIGIHRVHVEEDTGKLFHRDGYSLIDYNRSGVPLLEIVTEPDMNSVDEAYAVATGLRSLLRYLDVNSGDMEKGVIRFEANVSVRPVGSAELGTRTEIKNLNSFRAMTRAIEREVERQSRIVAGGGRVRQETLGWDEERQTTTPQRTKETASDYRYFPEPDLPPVEIDHTWVESIREGLPELPRAKRARFLRSYGLSAYTAGVLTAEREVAAFFEAALEAAPGVPPDRVANWLTVELFGLLNQAGIGIEASRVTSEAFGALMELLEAGRINATTGKAVLAEMFETGEPSEAIIEARGLARIGDPAEVGRLVEQVLAENPEQVAAYLKGKETLVRWLFGQVMRAAGGRADPDTVRRQLEAALSALREGSSVE